MTSFNTDLILTFSLFTFKVKLCFIIVTTLPIYIKRYYTFTQDICELKDIFPYANIYATQIFNISIDC